MRREAFMTIHYNKAVLALALCALLFACASVIRGDEPIGPIGPAIVVEEPLAEPPAYEAIAPGASSSARRVESQSNARQRGENSWRYKYHDGRWWYWLPSERWMMWENGRWIDPPSYSLEGAPAGAGEPGFAAPATQYPPSVRYAPSYRRQQVLTPRPRDWYYTGRTYDGPYYYYDEFYRPYGGMRPDPYYPVPRPYSGGYAPGQYYPSGPAYYNRPAYGGGISIGGGNGVRFGIGF
jgi:hypothetical protein